MPKSNSRDGKIGQCEGWGAEDTYLALTSDGWSCAD